MKILMLAQFFPPDIGGEERHVLNLANALVARGHQVVVGTQLLPGTDRVETLPGGVVVHRFTSSAMRLGARYSDPHRPHHLPLPDPALTTALNRLVERVRPDVVHAHNWIVNSAVALRRRYPFKLVLTLHDYSNVCATKRMMRDGRPCPGPGARCLPCAGGHYGTVVGAGTALAVKAMHRWKDHAVDHIVSVSNAVAQRNGVPGGPVPSSVIPNFVPDTVAELIEHADNPDLPPGDFLFFAGDLLRDKGVPTLLDAYQRLGAGRPPLVMVGRRSPAVPDELPAGVRVFEQWTHPRVMAAFRRCTLAVLPSTWPDPCPTTVLEAMAAGRPVITTSTGGMVDMVQDGVSGVLVAPGDAAALAKAIGRLLADPGLRDRLGDAGRARVEHFTASSVAARVEKVYQEVMAA
ncbi:glycosyltransferase family 4 protein [Actinoplanes teichomyceticus]|uniref:Glycosyltransferase involved in cell wall biosynthesis n=1 Tax=Actinoplanes teichomyceticus TaxID=1867 RepID=A0A561VG84_ACTTI|nr:glycosyltransferase family 4 protein [Actinoplanes teichomyceticus]TWG10625.1 glycosyltransferase involved in cell wall biosynthesis [Actinoplanes teichomyceticus]GIF15394.1 glycosyl transferase [Actinoplanes teichomyceticus]